MPALTLLAVATAFIAQRLPPAGVTHGFVPWRHAAPRADAIQTAADAVLASDTMLIAPALATSNVAMLGAEAEAATAGGADCLHFNVMDGHFTEKLTWGPMMVKALRAHGIQAPIDVQLTCGADIVDVQIEEFAAAGASYITFHAEGTRNIDRSLGLIKEKGLGCGVVLNPSTPTAYLENIMGKVDIILLMSNNPGFKNQKFQEVVYGKAQKVRKMIDESGRKIRLEVDGGAGVGNIKRLAECGIDMFVVGRGVFHADDYGKAISELRGLAEEGARSRCIFFTSLRLREIARSALEERSSVIGALMQHSALLCLLLVGSAASLLVQPACAPARCRPPRGGSPVAAFLRRKPRKVQPVPEEDESCLADEPMVECVLRNQVDGPWADTWAKYVLLRPGMSFGELKAATLERNKLDPSRRIPGTFRTVVIAHALCFLFAVPAILTSDAVYPKLLEAAVRDVATAQQSGGLL